MMSLVCVFYYYFWVDTSVDGVLVPEGTVPVVSVSALPWFNCYTYSLKFTLPR